MILLSMMAIWMMWWWDLIPVVVSRNNKTWNYGRNHNPNKPKDAHLKGSEENNQINKSPNKKIALSWSSSERDQLCDLFIREPDTLNEQYFDHDPYEWFTVYTKWLQQTNSDLYENLCQEYHNLIVENNKDLKNGSLIVRSVQELIESDDIIMIQYQGRLIWAIRSQKQLRKWVDDMYQRWWLYMLPEFRGDIGWLNLRDFLIKTINKRNTNKSMYGVVKTANKPTINSNLSSWFKTILVKNLLISSSSTYQEIVEARWWEDFKDMDTLETPEDYSVTYNDLAEKLFFQ